MSSNRATFKVFLQDQGVEEARRFVDDADAFTNFLYVKQRLQAVFPTLRDSDYKLTWKDSDGDEITIASDEDLITALTEMNDRVKVLYVTVMQRHADAEFYAEIDVRAHRIICDSCQTIIAGYRYKCLECPDFDLCTKCESNGIHPEHMILRIDSDKPIPRYIRRMMHHSIHSFRKAASNAARDSCRMARHLNRGAAQPERSAAGAGCSKEEAGTCNAKPGEGGQAKTGGAGGCPFAAGAEVSLQDLQKLARQHLAPFVEGESANNAANQGIGDLIRHALDGFFRAGAAGSQANNKDSAPKATPANATSTTGSEPVPPSQTASAPGATQTAQPTAMEVVDITRDDSPSPNTSPQQQESRRPEGWTIIDQIDEISAPAANMNGNNVPSAPAFTQHDNPIIHQGLVQLYEMGFSNVSGALTDLLIRYDGNVSYVVRHLLEN